VSSQAAPPTQISERLLPTKSTDVISSVRLILSLLAFLVITFEGFGSRESVNNTKALLVLYAIYAFVLWVPDLQTKSIILSIQRRAAWIDISSFILLFAFSPNHQTVFFCGFLFAILSAALNSGHTSAFKMSIASLIAIATIGILVELPKPEFELSRIWGSLLFLIAIVSVTAYLATSRAKLERQFLLLQEVTSLSNPHFGADRTIASVMERLRAFYAAASCVLVMAEAGSSSYRLRRVDCHGWDKALNGEVIFEEFNRQLRGLLSPKAVVYSRRSHGWLNLADRYHEIEVVDGIVGEPAEGEASDKVATMLEAESFLAVPLYRHNRVAGRLYLASHKRHAFGQGDARLVCQIMVRIFPIIENIRLAGRLASEAAERERTKIACDIHDSVIQPYVGIQLGLTALRRKIQRGEVDLDEEISTLMEMTDGEIFGLRRYMAGLTGTGVTEITLLESVRSFARKFSNASGIPVEIRDGSDIRIGDRLAEGAFHMIVEGLSNIRRHTRTTRAIIQIGCDGEYFGLRIEDEGSGERKQSLFMPQSIATRARALGGHVMIQQSDNGGTAISIRIPL
jgi:signal transduction histidine kinase